MLTERWFFPNLNWGYLKKEGCTKFGTCTKLYKIMIQFFMLKLHLEGSEGCMSPAPKFELGIAQEVRVYKIWDLVYKIVQNKYKIMTFFSFSKSVWGGSGVMYLKWRHIMDINLSYPSLKTVIKIISNEWVGPDFIQNLGKFRLFWKNFWETFIFL